jgi:hypothetical protein
MTQGLITIIENDKVKYKIITGIDGGGFIGIPFS